MRRALVTSLACAAALVGATADAQAPVPAPCTARVTGEFTLTLRQGGVVRSALVHVPRWGADRPLAVVLAFHGAGGDGPFMAEYSELSPLAEKDHFIVVYPT